MLPPARLLTHAVAALSGVVGGLTGSFVHSFTSYGVPFGLVMALALSASIFALARAATTGGSGAAVAVAGWLVPVVLLSTPRAEGDLIIAANPVGYAWLTGGALLAAMAVFWPRRRADNAAAGPSAGAGPDR